ncbi:MAG: iron chaperone, partial [Steroidobacteraceae bacterium]
TRKVANTKTADRARASRTTTVIDRYLARLPEPTRAALEKLREAIRAAAPTATETISYQLAAFKQEGMLVAFGAAASHCGFYVMSGTVLEGFRDELAEYKTSKGTIRFTPARPLPSALVKRIVAARIAENEARVSQRAKRGAAHRQLRSV